ncbi:carboxypeptidase-like regulatory domain-containing protein [Chryseobacterium sp. GP-SGM7]|uniref:carboxypeptidase-like regulatory domain-containing protein n=1 Tax=Chryseobacterium sp. GP-SGM7 TaxID=3411323 RepID=UPI003B951F19
MKIIQIENPCEEKWDNMQNIPDGKFCDLCSKTVLDLTQKSDEEILKILDESNGKICGRTFKYQSSRNSIVSEKKIISHEKRKGYSKLVAGFVIAASLTGIQTHAVTFEKPLIQISENKNYEESDLEKEKTDDPGFIISGKLINSDTGKPLPNIEVTFITKEKIFKTKTNQDGIYKLSVSDFHIRKNNNVLHFDFGGYNDKDFILLTKEELKNKEFSFESSEIDEMVVITGGISSRKLEPTLLLDGEEITEEEFQDLNRKDFKIFTFYGKTAKALCDGSSKDGLFLIFSK